MPKFKSILIFTLRLLLLYCLLIIPWPGMKTAYSNYFQSLANLVLARHDSTGHIQFQPLDDPNHEWPKNFDTKVVLASRDVQNHPNKVNAFMLTVDAWQMGWIPTAFLIALVLATPISWKRRLWAMLWGLLCVHGIILLTVGIFVWNESTRISLVVLTPFWKAIANQLEQLALDPVGPSFFAAALIWILVSFQRQDLARKV